MNVTTCHACGWNETAARCWRCRRPTCESCAMPSSSGGIARPRTCPNCPKKGQPDEAVTTQHTPGPWRDHNGRYNGGWGIGLCRDHGRLECRQHYGSHALAQCNNQDAMTGRMAYPTLTDEGPDCDICAAKGEASA